METMAFKPIFVIGSSRSGTTLMAKVLSGNNVVHVFPELHYFERLWDDEKDIYIDQKESQALYAKLKQAIHEGVFSSKPWQEYLEEQNELTSICGSNNRCTVFDVYRIGLLSETLAQGKSRPCEQTPRNLYYIEQLLNEYPKARVIVMVRDPRAILFSQMNKWKRKKVRKGKGEIPKIERLRRWANYHPILTSKLWNSSIKVCDAQKSDPRVKIVCFEDLVLKSEFVIREICNFLDLTFSEQMLSVSRSLSPTNSKQESTTILDDNGFDRSVVNRWREEIDAADIYWCERINARLMEQHKYTLTGIKPSLPILAITLISLPIKAGIAFVLNISKMSNIYKSVRRRLS